MARSLARDAEDFARLMLQTVERLGQDGSWVRAGDAFDQTVADHPGDGYVALLKTKPSRRIGLSTVVERVREAEFPRLERRKAGTRRNAPVYYRIGRPNAAFDLHLPYDVAPSHPLVVQRRAAGTEPVSARRAALTERPPKSPWRRRLLVRPSDAAVGVEAAFGSPRRWWARLRARLTALAADVTGRKPRPYT